MIVLLLAFAASWVIVDLIGYWLHRLAHRPWSPMYRAHMTHHVRNYPAHSFLSDIYRPSGTDSLGVMFAPVFVLYVVLAFALLPWEIGLAVSMGAVPPAVLSTVVHDMTHIRGSIAWEVPALRSLAIHHYAHHRRMGRNFGVTNRLWDRIFRTWWETTHRPE